MFLRLLALIVFVLLWPLLDLSLSLAPRPMIERFNPVYELLPEGLREYVALHQVLPWDVRPYFKDYQPAPAHVWAHYLKRARVNRMCHVPFMEGLERIVFRVAKRPPSVIFSQGFFPHLDQMPQIIEGGTRGLISTGKHLGLTISDYAKQVSEGKYPVFLYVCRVTHYFESRGDRAGGEIAVPFIPPQDILAAIPVTLEGGLYPFPYIEDVIQWNEDARPDFVDDIQGAVTALTTSYHVLATRSAEGQGLGSSPFYYLVQLEQVQGQEGGVDVFELDLSDPEMLASLQQKIVTVCMLNPKGGVVEKQGYSKIAKAGSNYPLSNYILLSPVIERPNALTAPVILPQQPVKGFSNVYALFDYYRMSCWQHSTPWDLTRQLADNARIFNDYPDNEGWGYEFSLAALGQQQKIFLEFVRQARKIKIPK